MTTLSNDHYGQDHVWARLLFVYFISADWLGGGFLGTWPMVSLMILYLLMVISDEGGGQQRRCAVGRTTCYHAMFCSLSGISAVRRGAKKAFRS